MFAALGGCVFFCMTFTVSADLSHVSGLHQSLPFLGWKGKDYCDGSDWTYTKPQCAKQGDMATTKEASEWDSKYKQCGDNLQSPIKISFMQTSFKNFEPIQFSGYDVPFTFFVENGGNALYITPQEADLESYGGPLSVRYNLSKAVFHFGNGTGHGSEHKIDNEIFAAELQLLISSEKPTSGSCFLKGNGVAIFVILFKQRSQSNPWLDPFINATDNLQYRGNWTKMVMPLSHFLPSTTLDYYLYAGSLTFPPCTSGITVIVFSTPVPIGDSQLMKLRGNLVVYVNNCKNVVYGNLRETRNLSNRVVYRSFKFIDTSGATVVVGSSVNKVVWMTLWTLSVFLRYTLGR
ncbi:carbonic anhydrase 1-like isoform X2 [Ornithodoros turicata]|uniref:carbonic anhydrase 1-like isoform X2 n=1 Tax=Ornithodoros turicata TaxID=34597 RepID=UPI003139F6FE